MGVNMQCFIIISAIYFYLTGLSVTFSSLIICIPHGNGVYYFHMLNIKYLSHIDKHI